MCLRLTSIQHPGIWFLSGQLAKEFTCFNMQVCITTSTSAALEQILPWMFYHKVIGVTTFFLFVEGKAASPGVSKVLESIPVSSSALFTFLLLVPGYSFLFLGRH